jgi:hypothetical protein
MEAGHVRHLDWILALKWKGSPVTLCSLSYFEKESVDDWGSRRGIRRYKEPTPNRCPPPNFGLLFSPPFLIFYIP